METAPTSTDRAIVGRIRHLMGLRRMSQAGLAKLIGIDASNVSKYLSGKLPISDAFLNRIVVNLSVSKHWLQAGIGIPFEKGMTSADTEKNISSTSLPILNPTAIPIYDIDVAAGITEFSREHTLEFIKGYISIPDFSPKWVAVKAQGDSMTPIIDDGAYIVFLPENDLEHIVWGQIYIVIMDNRRVVKFVRKHPNPEYVILKSKNEEYDSMDIRLADIRVLYPVKAVVNVKMQL